MGVINTSDLRYKYSWTALPGDNPKVTGEPDSTLLNRNEGYEIIYFINKFCEIYRLKKIASALKIERMIKSDLPSNIRSQENIRKWIYDNWNNYNY